MSYQEQMDRYRETSNKSWTFLDAERAEIKGIRRWFDERGLDAAFFDLDDTGIRSVENFVGQTDLYIDAVSKSFPQIERDFLLENLREVNTALYNTRFVNPNRWDFVVDEMTKKFGGSAWVDEIHYLRDIYKLPAVVYQDFRFVLDRFQAARIPRALVTHAEEDWTYFKLNTGDLERYFNLGVYCINVDGPKGPEQWREKYREAGVLPSRAVAFGDSERGDAMANYEIGCQHIYLIRRNNPRSLLKHKGIILPPSITELTDLREFLEIIKKG